MELEDTNASLPAPTLIKVNWRNLSTRCVGKISHERMGFTATVTCILPLQSYSYVHMVSRPLRRPAGARARTWSRTRSLYGAATGSGSRLLTPPPRQEAVAASSSPWQRRSKRPSLPQLLHHDRRRHRMRASSGARRRRTLQKIPSWRTREGGAEAGVGLGGCEGGAEPVAVGSLESSRGRHGRISRRKRTTGEQSNRNGQSVGEELLEGIIYCD